MGNFILYTCTFQIVTYEGELLLQGVHDNVEITLLQA